MKTIWFWTILKSQLPSLNKWWGNITIYDSLRANFSDDKFLVEVSKNFEYEENDDLYTPDDQSSGRKIGNRPTKPGKDTEWKATTMTGMDFGKFQMSFGLSQIMNIYWPLLIVLATFDHFGRLTDLDRLLITFFRFR